MYAIQNQPTMNDLHQLIAQVPRYPITLRRLINLAKRKGVKEEVVNFYRVFPDDTVFSDEDDITARSEQIEIMRSENPPEEFFRGFED